jgi:hypothetical protein
MQESIQWYLAQAHPKAGNNSKTKLVLEDCTTNWMKAV